MIWKRSVTCSCIFCAVHYHGKDSRRIRWRSDIRRLAKRNERLQLKWVQSPFNARLSCDASMYENIRIDFQSFNYVFLLHGKRKKEAKSFPVNSKVISREIHCLCFSCVHGRKTFESFISCVSFLFKISKHERLNWNAFRKNFSRLIENEEEKHWDGFFH